jgi:hypothetical protein
MKYTYGSTVLYTDLVDGNSAIYTVDGWQITRMAKVSGGMENYAGYAKIIQASYFLAQEGAVIGQPHPGCPTARLREISPIAVSPDTVEFRLVYRDDPVLKISCQSGLSQEDTNIDATGLVISTTYTYPADYKDPTTGELSDLHGKEIVQGGTVQKFLPDISFSYHRTETRFWYGAMGIIELQKSFVGAINDGNWLLGGYIQNPWTWMCTGITGDSDDGGIQYQMTYTFSYRSRIIENVEYGWRPWVCFVRDDGKPAPDVEPKTEAYHDIPLYRVMNFNALNIDYTQE